LEVCRNKEAGIGRVGAKNSHVLELEAEGIAQDNPDDFGLLLLETVPANFVVYVTDRGVLSDGSLRSGEGILQYTSGEERMTRVVRFL